MQFYARYGGNAALFCIVRNIGFGAIGRGTGTHQ